MAKFGFEDGTQTGSLGATSQTQNASGGGAQGASGGGGWGGVPAQASSQVANASGGQGGGYQGGGGGGLQSGSGGNFIEGVGNYLGFGKPTTIGGVEGPKLNRDDYNLGGSQQAAQDLQNASMNRANAYGGRSANFDPRRANAYLSYAGSLRPDEAALTTMLQDRAMGRGPSLAADTYTKGAQDATRRAQSLATGARGGAGLLGARQAAELGFEGAQDAALQSGMIKSREMQDAAGMLGQNLAARNQAELARGGFGLDIARSGADVGQRQFALNDAAQNAELGRYMQMLQMQQQGLMGYNQQQGGFDLDAARINAGIDTTNLGQQNAQDAKRGALIKGAMGVIGGPVGGLIGSLF